VEESSSASRLWMYTRCAVSSTCM